MTDYSNNNVNKSSSTLGGIFEYHSKMITDNHYNTLKCSSNENMKEYLLTRPVIEPNKDNDKVNSPLTCVMPDGLRYFLRMRTDDDHNNNINNNNNDNASGFLLSKPMSELTKVADRMLVARHVRIQQELEKHASLNEQSKLKHIQGFNEDDDIDLLISNTQNDIKHEVDDKPNKKSEKGVLWVEKYSPNAFSQLLSSEKINRDVLKAVKGWDRFVFKDTDHNISKGSLPGPFTPAKVKGSAQKNNTKNSGTADEEPDDEMDIEENIKDLRPYQKVILLCGPPGTGKTTLAHCIAKHCGYRPFEINASDDRSKDVLVESITKSMQSTLDWEQKSKDNKSKSSISNTPSKEKLKEKTSGKPNCLILDEIDGIDSRNTIDAIINIVKAPLYVKDKNKSKKGKSNKATVLTRPMICICNDQFAPNLRELKKMALVYVFQPPSEVRLVQRLKAICSAERLQVTTSALTALCSATGNDIRSSLNTLQFASLHASKLSQDASSTSSSSMSTLGVASTLTSMISSGLKDENKDIYQIWREVFSSKEISSVLSQKRSRLLLDNSNAIDANEKPSGIQPSMEVFQSALSFGDMPLVMSGVHENMLKIRYSDPTMVRTFMCCNWLSISDNIDAFAYNWSDGYQTQVYIPVSLGAIHMLRATENRVNIEWPMKDRNVHYQRQQRLNIMSSLREGPEQGRGIIHSTTLSSNKIIALDVVSYLLDILRPRNVRAVSYGTLSVPEKNMLQDVVKVMASCGLSYISASHAETHNAFSYNQPSLALEPAISDLVKYAECENDLIKNRHTDLAMELCNHISLELKKYLIISRDVCDEAYSSSIPSKTPTKANIPLPSKDISMHQQRSIDDNAAKLIKGQEMDAAEIAMQKRILKGRMDFFCKAAPKKDNDVSKKENNSNKRSVSELNSDMTTTTTTTTQVDQQYKKPVLFYKFNQGFSNAVRRPVSIEDFC